jgi:hypothetical protein
MKSLEGYELNGCIFRKTVRHYITGQIIRPKKPGGVRQGTYSRPCSLMLALALLLPRFISLLDLGRRD